jgi:hypothetical protein
MGAEREALVEVAHDVLVSASEYTMRREEDTLTLMGNRVAGRWVLRDPAGVFVDFDQYRHDLIERNGFRTAY